LATSRDRSMFLSIKRFVFSQTDPEIQINEGIVRAPATL
jgi:hypothetical protein